MADEVPVSAAAAGVATDDATVALKLYAVDQLTGLYGFAPAVAEQAVEDLWVDGRRVEDMATVVADCCHYILDRNLGQDQGGPVTPIATCPHMEKHCCITTEQLPFQPAHTVCTHLDTATGVSGVDDDRHQHVAAGNNNSDKPPRSSGSLKEDTTADNMRCTGTENWLCLECGVVRCSRYVNGHALQHWQDTTVTTTHNTSSTSTSNATNSDQDGHCLAVSLSDLSVWCHQCQAYLVTHGVHPALQHIVQTLEQLKFASDSVTIEMQEAPPDERHHHQPAKKKHKSDSEQDDSSSDGGE